MTEQPHYGFIGRTKMSYITNGVMVPKETNTAVVLVEDAVKIDSTNVQVFNLVVT
jgi:hypothetical protein